MESKVIVVTGGTRGIGKAVSEKFLKAGYKVVAISKGHNKDLAKSVEELSALGEVTYVAGNVSSREDCKAAVDAAIEKYGRIDVLANVAGIVGPQGDLVINDMDALEEVIKVNVFGSFYMAKYAAEQMIKQKSGVIVNIGSSCGLLANHENVAYHASKGAIRMFTQALAKEVSPYGIRCVSVAPAGTSTEMVMDQIAKNGEEMLTELSEMKMKGRLIKPEEIAGAVYLMTLPEASCINGSTVMADDGYCEFKGVKIVSKV